MDNLIHLILAALLLNAVQAHVRDKGPQTFSARPPQNGQQYRKIILYLTPTEIRNYEAGRGLPDPLPEDASYTNEQQKPESRRPLNDEEGRIIQSTLDVLEANRINLQQRKNNTNNENRKAQESQNEDSKPIVEPNADEPPTRLYAKATQEQQRNKYEEQSSKDQENGAKSYAYVHFYSNREPEIPEKIEIFHPEPRNVNQDEERRQQRERNTETQQDSLQRQNVKLIYRRLRNSPAS